MNHIKYLFINGLAAAALIFAPLCVAAFSSGGNPFSSDGVSDWQYTLYYTGQAIASPGYKVYLSCVQPLKAEDKEGRTACLVTFLQSLPKDPDSTPVTPHVPTPPTAAAPVPTPNDAAKNYRERYYNKCIDIYRNQDVASCCSALASADTQSMEQKGAFDTVTTAEIPVLVDENKCKVPESEYKCKTDNLTGSLGSACDDYLKRCIEAGKYASFSDADRLSLCQSDFRLQRPIQLNFIDKYVSQCVQKGGDRFACKDALTSKHNDYWYKCMIGVGDHFWSEFFLAAQRYVNRKKYDARSQTCDSKFSSVIDTETGL